ncbi:MAG: EAL domain-containing protein [Gammaproteobacteria bacterium]|nr:EAL domain-containing protein [Gammaproteobacteria bacterium]
MSLSKQLLILISLLFFLIMTVNFVASVSNIRDYLEIEAQTHAQDTATSLGLSLQPYIGDPTDAMLEAMVVSIFDSGFYQEIRLSDMENNEIISRASPSGIAGVPDWFISLLPMKTAVAEKEVSSGWIISGKLFITISPGFAYTKLWEQSKAALMSSAIVFVVSVSLLLILLRLVLKPLGRIEQLAVDIADGRFGVIEPLPWTTEIKTVARSMNLMSRKTEGVINSLHAKLEEASKRLKVDDLTGLETQGGFDVAMKRVFIDRAKSHLVVTRIEGLGTFARDHGHVQADKLVKEFAQALRQVGEGLGEEVVFPFRLIGAKFVVVLRGDKALAEAYCSKLTEELLKLAEKFAIKDVAHMGIAPVDLFGTTNASMDLANEGYEKARIIGPNSSAYQESEASNRDMDEWRNLLTEVIDQVRFDISLTQQAIGLKGEVEGKVLLAEAYSQAFDSHGAPIPIGTFVSLAESFGLVLSFDKAVVNKIIKMIGQQNIHNDVAINLSLAAITDPGFLDWLADVVRHNESVRKQLVFGVTAYGATKDLNAFKGFVNFVHGMGCKVLLKRFEPSLIPLNALKEYKLDYIRLARSYTQGIALDEQKRRLVESMAELGDLIDVRVLAESVEDDDDFAIIRQVGLFGASR